ncbi:MAG: hypothetical protein HZB38_16360, partial [Planctomycetes bacterium]|nr:hypothetical protein [Planctomycetota bacterium]
MAKRQLNKNVIGALTAVAVLALVSTVGVASYTAGKKDPQFLAQKAEESRKAGDLKRAKELYGRAFNVGRDAHYLID